MMDARRVLSFGFLLFIFSSGLLVGLFLGSTNSGDMLPPATDYPVISLPAVTQQEPTLQQPPTPTPQPVQTPPQLQPRQPLRISEPATDVPANDEIILSATKYINSVLPKPYQIEAIQTLRYQETSMSLQPKLQRTFIECTLSARLKEYPLVNTSFDLTLLSSLSSEQPSPNVFFVDPPLRSFCGGKMCLTPSATKSPPVTSTAARVASIIYITKRSGSLDLLLHSLSQQTDTRFELIIVDELALHRKSEVASLAESLRVPIIYHSPSKPKTNPHRYGTCNAINTGFIMAKGYVSALVTERTWLPPNFVERIHTFYGGGVAPARYALLAFPTQTATVPSEYLDSNALESSSAISFFTQPLTKSPLEMGWLTAVAQSDEGNSAKSDFVKDKEYWPALGVVIPTSLVQRINGLDEELDRAEENHAKWIKKRGEALGYATYTDRATHLQIVTVDEPFNLPREEAGGLVERLLDKVDSGVIGQKARNVFDLEEIEQKQLLSRVLGSLEYHPEQAINKFPIEIAAKDKPSEAYATLVGSSSYVKAAVALAFSLEAVGTGGRPTVALIGCPLTPDEKEALDIAFTYTQIVPAIPNPMHNLSFSATLDFASKAAIEKWQKAFPRSHMTNLYTKLHLWSLTQYSKLIYLDADTVVLKNIDELFERPQLSAVPDVIPSDTFNSGLMVLEPSEQTFNDMLVKMHELPSYGGGDQGFLNMYFNDWFNSSAEHSLPIIYNTLTKTKTIDYPNWIKNKPNIRVLHFTPEKPWKSTKEEFKPEVAHWRQIVEMGIKQLPPSQQTIVRSVFEKPDLEEKKSKSPSSSVPAKKELLINNAGEDIPPSSAAGAGESDIGDSDEQSEVSANILAALHSPGPSINSQNKPKSPVVVRSGKKDLPTPARSGGARSIAVERKKVRSVDKVVMGLWKERSKT